MRQVRATQVFLLALLGVWAVYNAICIFLGVPAIDSLLRPGGGDYYLGSSARHSPENLVLYIYSASDPEYLENLRFFVREAVQGDERSHYIIVLQGQDSDAGLPELPSHAKYILHSNTCYDWGTHGWVLEEAGIDISLYKFFFFINCSVRGPYLPAYARGSIHWTQPFVRRLTSEVKLVGPTISCEGSPLDGDVLSKWRRNPHVQSYAVATDQVGLSILRAAEGVFSCHEGRWNTIYHSELGSSAAILHAGYNLDCFMTRYQGVDWRDSDNWECNRRYSPQGESYYDGITLDPLEVMFVKLKSFSLQHDLSSARKAAKYDEWMQRDPSNWTSVTSNEFLTHTARFKVPKILEAKARGSACFDFAFYLENNPDLQGVLETHEAQWRHFVYMGQFETRPSRFTCPMDLDSLTLSNEDS